MSRRGQMLVALGAILALAGILLAASFEFVDNHAWYWNAPHILCIVTLLAGGFGSFLLGDRVAPKRRVWLVVLGGILGLAWVLLGLLAFSFTFLAANYFAGDSYLSWDSYHGDYQVGWYHIRALQAATTAGVIGGFLTGFGWARKSKPILD